MSFIGASMGTFLGLFIQTAANFFFLSKHSMNIPLKENVVMPMVSGCLLVLFFCALGTGNNMVVLFPGILLYMTTLFVLRVFSREDVDYVRRILRAEKST
jgi:O-antigen/teichoic acid export membrane protein